MKRRYSEWEIDTNGVTTVVSEWGEGEDVMVLVHGVSGNRMTWSDLARRLAADGYRVLAPDLRGCGTTIAKGDLIGRHGHRHSDWNGSAWPAIRSADIWLWTLPGSSRMWLSG
jgi:pimeloyl-ACP methyl ester carboxylesterase